MSAPTAQAAVGASSGLAGGAAAADADADAAAPATAGENLQPPSPRRAAAGAMKTFNHRVTWDPQVSGGWEK